jgi:tetratricopeptide (TPR) repeat protein
MHEPYELAWVYRFTRARETFMKERNDQNKERLVAVLQKIVGLWPNDEWPQQYLGRVYDLEDRTADALGAFEKARDRDPDDANNHCSIGDCLLELGRREDAKKAFEAALERDPGHVRSNENLANVSFDLGDTSMAEVLNACALEQAPENPFNWHVRGRIAAQKGNSAEAAAAYGKALELAPGTPFYVVQRARNLANAGDVEAALESLRALAEKRSDDAYTMVQWADIAYEHGRSDVALEACERLEKIDATHASAYAIAGAARCQRGELDAGIAVIRKALALAPAYGWAYREMGKHLGAAGRHEEALTALAAAAGVAPGAQATFQLGAELARAGHAPKGLEFMKRVADSGELSQKDYEKLASVLLSVNGPAAAHSFFQNLGEQRPRDAGLFAAHALFLVEGLWYPGAAASVIAKLSELDPEHPLVVAKEGDDLMDASLELEPKGEELLRKAVAKAPSLTYPRRSLVRQLNVRGRYEESLALLEPARSDEETTEDRVQALLGLGREGSAREVIDAYAGAIPDEGRERAARPLLYRVAFSARRFDEALRLADLVSADEGEQADDGELSPWEKKRFECLVALGKSDEAYEFGEAQCDDADDRGYLAYVALKHDDYPLALRFAEAALNENPNEESSLHVMAKHAEMAGDVDRAVSLWERMIEVTGWHIHVENIARVSLGRGDLERARRDAEKAVATGHVCPVAAQVRAEARLVSGDRAGAEADARRALAYTQLEWKTRSEDTRGLLAGLAGRRAEAKTLYETFLSREKLSSNGRLRVSKLMEVLGL